MDDFDKAVEKEVEDVREYLENIIALMPGHIFWKDLNCRFLGCNDAQAKIAGMSSRHEIVGKSSIDVISRNQPEYLRRQQADAIDRTDRRIMRTGISETVEEPLILEDGTEQIFLSQKVAIRDKNNNIIGLLGVSVDITDKKQAEELKAKQALMDVAAQVSHDIRSPLAALNTVLTNIPTLPEDQRILIRNAVRRINDIANNLLVEYRDEATANNASNIEKQESAVQKPELLSSLLDTLLSEKKAQMDARHVELNLNIDVDAFGLFVIIDSIQFKRVISNLLNNAIEAIEGTGEVTIYLEKQVNQVRISLIDTGKGMSPAVVEKIKQGGATHDKTGGTGIGITSAISLIEASKGHFDIISKEGKGTTVILEFPTVPAPSWFQETLLFSPGSTVVVLDDDESIHAIWTSRCQPFLSEITLKHIHHSKTFREYCTAADLSHSVFLVDYELLRSEESGLDLIEQLNLSDRSILVTSRYEENKVQVQANKLGVKIIPKNFSPYIPILLAKQANPALVLVDDDTSLTYAWEQAAKFENIFIKTFNRTADLRKILPTLLKTTPIYIDSSLCEPISGEAFAKELYEKGFTELYLASGYPRNHFGDLPWIKDFTGKEPPF